MNHEATIATLNMQLDNCAKDLYEKDKRIAELERQLAEASAPAVERPYRHIKSGKLYELLYIGALEADLTVSAIYRCTQTGQVWVRPMIEFSKKFELAASMAAQAPVREVPEGFAIAPKIPTEEMLRAALSFREVDANDEIRDPWVQQYDRVYRAMIAAAPLPAAPVQQEGE